MVYTDVISTVELCTKLFQGPVT